LRSDRALQRPDRLLEGDAVGAQQMRGGALAIADDGRQHDGAVDLSPPGLLGSGRRGFENTPQVGRHREVGGRARLGALLDAAEVAGNVRSQARQVDARGLQDQARFLILGEGQQQMFEGHLEVSLGARIFAGARQRRRQALRHRDSAQFVDDHPRTRRPRRIGTTRRRTAAPLPESSVTAGRYPIPAAPAPAALARPFSNYALTADCEGIPLSLGTKRI
jgi:hypothetical protein